MNVHRVVATSLYKLVYGACFMGLRATQHGTLGAAISAARLGVVRRDLQSCGERLHVQFPVTIANPDGVQVGSDVSLAAYVHIWGSGGVQIGSRVMIGAHTSISSVTHDCDAEVMYGVIVQRPVRLHDDVWIGSNCMIMPGVTVGRGAVVGAGSVVTKDVPPGAVVAGVPATILRFRRQFGPDRLAAHTRPPQRDRPRSLGRAPHSVT